jgi:hypothetical protein
MKYSLRSLMVAVLVKGEKESGLSQASLNKPLKPEPFFTPNAQLGWALEASGPGDLASEHEPHDAEWP